VVKAGQTMEQVVESVTRVNDIMGEISSASEEQSRGIEQISRAVMELDTTTQQNASLVGASSTAAGALEDQARAAGAGGGVPPGTERAGGVINNPAAGRCRVFAYSKR
jgi:methyl-accepting chemotaxis protein